MHNIKHQATSTLFSATLPHSHIWQRVQHDKTTDFYSNVFRKCITLSPSQMNKTPWRFVESECVGVPLIKSC